MVEASHGSNERQSICDGSEKQAMNAGSGVTNR